MVKRSLMSRVSHWEKTTILHQNPQSQSPVVANCYSPEQNLFHLTDMWVPYSYRILMPSEIYGALLQRVKIEWIKRSNVTMNFYLTNNSACTKVDCCCKYKIN